MYHYTTYQSSLIWKKNALSYFILQDLSSIMEEEKPFLSARSSGGIWKDFDLCNDTNKDECKFFPDKTLLELVGTRYSWTYSFMTSVKKD